MLGETDVVIRNDLRVNRTLRCGPAGFIKLALKGCKMLMHMSPEQTICFA